MILYYTEHTCRIFHCDASDVNDSVLVADMKLCFSPSLGCCHRCRRPWVWYPALLSVWWLWQAGQTSSLQNPPTHRRAVCLVGHRSRLRTDGLRHSGQSWRSSVCTWFVLTCVLPNHPSVWTILVPPMSSWRDCSGFFNLTLKFCLVVCVTFSSPTFEMSGRPERSNLCAHWGGGPEW